MSSVAISPSILYWGTPVVLVSTLNPDGTPNLAPISSVFWLSTSGILGMLSCSQSAINLLRTSQCVLNLPSDDMLSAVNGISRTTGTPEVPALKVALGYVYDKDKFKSAGLTPQKSEIVDAPRVKECPVQMEAELMRVHEMGEGGMLSAVEVRIVKVWVKEEIRGVGGKNRVDPDKWRPLIMSFQQYYGLGGRLGTSRLGEIDEDRYRR